MDLESQILASSRDCIKIIDHDGRLTFMNPGGLKALEIDDFESIRGSIYLDLWRGDDREQVARAIQSARAGGAAEFTGFFPTTKTRQPKWWHVVFTPIRDGAGAITQVLAISRDVTLVKDPIDFDQIFSKSPSFMSLLSVPDFRFLKSNAQHQKLIRKTNIIGKTLREVEPDLEAQGIIEVLENIVKTGTPFVGKEVPIYYPPADGEPARTAYLDFVFEPLRRPSSEIYAIAALGHDVTEKVLGRKAVENEKENFRNLFRQTPEMVCILKGPEHEFEFVNKAHIKALGFDATGMKVRVAQPESVEVHGILDGVYRTGKTAELHEIPVTLTDRVRYFNLTYSARRDEAGQVSGIMILGSEVTDQVLARRTLENAAQKLEFAVLERTRELTKSKDFLDSVIENLPNMVFIKDTKDLRFVRFNRAGEELLGLSREELLGKNDYDFFPKEQADHFVAKDREVLRGNAIVDIPEEPIVSKKHGRRVLHTRKIPIFGVDGKPEYLLGISEDITMRKQAEGERLKLIHEQATFEERKRENERASFLAEASMLLASSLDYHQTLKELARLAVPSLSDWCTVTTVKEGLVKDRVAIFHRDPSKNPLIEALTQYQSVNADETTGIGYVIRSGKSLFMPLVFDKDLAAAAKDARHLEIIRSLGCGSCIVSPIVIRDTVHGAISLVSAPGARVYNENDLALAEELGRRAGIAIENALLYEAEQRAVKVRDEFMSIASHELKTPLTSLKLQSQIRSRALRKGEFSRFAPEKLPELVADDERQLNRLIRLVDDMLDVSRIQTGKLSLSPEKFDLREMVEDTLARFAPQIQLQGCHVDFRTKESSIGTWDRYRMEQVFTNLLTNALKYGVGSTIEISVSSDLDTAKLSVSDRGLGIDKKDHERIFGRFERAVAGGAIGGLGVGLYISKKIVEAHGGTIKVDSELNRGATFTISMPRSAVELVTQVQAELN